jgi:hypothetical protein
MGAWWSSNDRIAIIVKASPLSVERPRKIERVSEDRFEIGFNAKLNSGLIAIAAVQDFAFEKLDGAALVKTVDAHAFANSAKRSSSIIGKQSAAG